MAIKIQGSTIIDDSRNISSAGITTVSSVSIGNIQVISSGRELQNIDSIDSTTITTNDLNVIGVSTLGNTSTTSLDATGIEATSINISGVATASSGFIGNLIGDVTGTATTAQGLTGTPNIIVGTIDATSVNASGIITATGGFNLGISSAGTAITTGPINTLNFVGTGNTFAVNGTTVDISISGGGGGGGGGYGYGSFNPGITSNISATLSSTGGDILVLPSTSGLRYIIHSINASNIAVGNTEVNVIGAFDISGGERSYFSYNIPIPKGTSVELLKQPQVLNPSDKIVMRATDFTRVGIDNSVQVHISYQIETNTNLFGVGLGSVSLASTSATDLYTSTTYPSVVQSIRLANRTDTGNYTASITIRRGGTSTYLVDDLIIPKYGSVEVLDNQKSLEIGDKIQIILDQAQSIDAQVSGIIVST